MTALDAAPAAAPATPERVARMKHPRAIRWMHWINFPLLFIMIWSGLRIYWANDVYSLWLFGYTFDFFPEWFYERLDLNQHLARGMAFHFTFGWLFAINGLAYLGYLAWSGEWRHLVPDRRGLVETKDVVLHDLHLRDEAPPQGRYNAAQQVSYCLVILMGIVIVLSGLAIFKPTQLAPLVWVFGGYESARLIHFFTSMAILAFFVVHVLQVARAGFGNFASMVTGYEIEDAEQAETEPADADAHLEEVR